MASWWFAQVFKTVKIKIVLLDCNFLQRDARGPAKPQCQQLWPSCFLHGRGHSWDTRHRGQGRRLPAPLPGGTSVLWTLFQQWTQRGWSCQPAAWVFPTETCNCPLSLYKVTFNKVIKGLNCNAEIGVELMLLLVHSILQNIKRDVWSNRYFSGDLYPPSRVPVCTL